MIVIVAMPISTSGDTAVHGGNSTSRSGSLIDILWVCICIINIHYTFVATSFKGTTDIATFGRQ
jgi:hypothetical protein